MRLCIFVFCVSVCCYGVDAFVCVLAFEAFESIWKHLEAFATMWENLLHLKSFESSWLKEFREHLEHLGAFNIT